jgi:FlaA1/EpsC-like NDP-sugar epimerase
MLKRHASIFIFLQSVFDVIVVGALWIGVYFLRFKSGLFETGKGLPEFSRHMLLTIPICMAVFLSCLWSGMYAPKRLQSLFAQFLRVLKSCVFSLLLILAFFYYTQENPYSRKLLVLFIAVLSLILSGTHVLKMYLAQILRHKGYNLRYCAIIGAGKKGQQLMRDIVAIGWMGIRCSYFIDNNTARIGKLVRNIPVYGPVSSLLELVETKPVDEIYLALSGDEAAAAFSLLEKIHQRGITVRIIPDWGNLTSTHTSVIPIGSQLLFCAGESPLTGYRLVLKEMFDRLTALVLLVILCIPMLLITVLVKLTSKGPVLYKQVRIGMDQREFLYTNSGL